MNIGSLVVEWVHVKGTGRALPKAPRVNIEVKAKYKDSIKKFFEWGMTMSPLMPLEDNEYLYKHHQDLIEAYGLEKGQPMEESRWYERA